MKIGELAFVALPCVGLFAALTLPEFKPAALPKPLPVAVEGVYSSKPFNLVRIAERGEGIIIRWMNDGANGIGFRDGNTLVFAYTNPAGILGTVRYKIEVDAKGNPRLVGRWLSSPGTGKVNDETLDWLMAVPNWLMAVPKDKEE